MAQQKRGKNFFPTHGISILLMALSLVLVSISTHTIVTLPGRIASTIAGAFQQIFSSIGNSFKGTVFAIQELSDLRNQYEALSKEMESFKTMERDYTEIKAENNRLKDQLGFAQNITTVVSPARIIAKDPGNIYSSYVIDKGIRNGVAKNLAVTAFQNGTEGLVGKIISPRNGTSLVIPIFDQRFFVSARLSRTRAEGLVNGRGNAEDVLEMRYISKLNALDVQVGDLVVTSGLDSIYPPDIAIGRVKKVELPEYSSSAMIHLEPSLDFSRLEYLFVIRKENTTLEVLVEQQGK
jgi:rod shape-determining protein MreC